MDVKLIIALVVGGAMLLATVLVMLCPKGGFHKYRRQKKGYVCKKCNHKSTIW